MLREVEKKDIFRIAEETQELAGKAMEGGLMPDDLAGGTFTISVLGSVDGFTPILNQGQSAIMGIGRSVAKPVVRDHEITIRDMMTVSLTADHSGGGRRGCRQFSAAVPADHRAVLPPVQARRGRRRVESEDGPEISTTPSG